MGALEKYVSFKGRDDGGAFIMPNGIQLCQSVLRLEDKVIPGAPYFSIVWYINPGTHGGTPHTHDFDEFVGFIGSDPEDWTNLNGKIKIYIDGEWLEIDKSFVMYSPAGVEHCPYEILELEKPIIHFSGSPSTNYGRASGEFGDSLDEK